MHSHIHCMHVRLHICIISFISATGNDLVGANALVGQAPCFTLHNILWNECLYIILFLNRFIHACIYIYLYIHIHIHINNMNLYIYIHIYIYYI